MFIPGNEIREELFEEPVTQRALKTHAPIDAQLRVIGQSGIPIQLGQLHKILANITSLDRTISEAAGRLVADLMEPVEQMGQLGEQFRSALTAAAQIDLSPLLEISRTVGSMLDYYEAFYKAFVADYLAPFQETLNRIALSFRPLLDEISRVQARSLARTLHRYHWWPVPGLPFEFYKGILDLIEQRQARRVNRYICDWFRWNRYRRLGRMVRRWDSNKYFRRRRPIYTQALMAHRRGWYNLTVPALVPLVEGIARDYLQEEHGITERRGLVAVQGALDQNIPANVFREELQQALIRFLTSSTFADTNNVLPSGYELNRHGVAHGRHLRYGTEANSLRCFLLLERVLKVM